jgi:hypothetical protein
MILTDTDQYIKLSLESIISGKWNEYFYPEQIRNLLQLSFILNHLVLGEGYFEFQYNDIKIKVTQLDDTISNEWSFESVISAIKNDEGFLASLKQFLRDRKIEKIFQ